MEKTTNLKSGTKGKGSKKQTLTIRRQFDPTYQGTTTGEKNTMPSQTEPDMALTVSELLRNHTRGIGSNIKHYPLNYMETEIPKINDLTDLDDFREKNAQKKKNVQMTIDDEIKARTVTPKEETIPSEPLPPKTKENETNPPKKPE